MNETRFWTKQLKCRFSMLITGTPVHNDVGDMVRLLEIFNGEIFQKLVENVISLTRIATEDEDVSMILQKVCENSLSFYNSTHQRNFER